MHMVLEGARGGHDWLRFDVVYIISTVFLRRDNILAFQRR